MSGHAPYFAALEQALKNAGVAQPTMVVDLRRLDANIDAAGQTLAPMGLGLRAVSKSLQAPALLGRVMERAATDKVMVFNTTMLDDILAWRSEADVLLGRPQPAAAAAGFMRHHAGDAAVAARPVWLVDSLRRLSQYAEIARASGLSLRICLEVDVGLHRGGFDEGPLAEAIGAARAEPLIEIAGLMGYDAHAAAAPDPAAEVARALARLARAKAVLAEALGGDPARLVIDTAGSLTFALHADDAVATELALGSALVKPANYDATATQVFEPACFIAEPVLKIVDPALAPGAERPQAAPARGIFMFGGWGDARLVSPLGLSFHPAWGRSMLQAGPEVALAEDDFVFLRPRESEGTLLQFGDLAVFDGRAIVDRWPTFRAAA
ncbi:MAG TPA: alanine racemase [Caulobacteraceae bacterium]|nr:alanine racemase [Caulobacteraceae bacterium]